jgi:limonene-1,2-epoxide hydrolase
VTATQKVAYGSMQVRLPISFLGVSIAQIRNKRIVCWSDYYDQAQSRRIGVAAYFADWIEL